MTVSHRRKLAAIVVSVIALSGVACTKDKMTGDGNMMSGTGSMNKMDTDKKMPSADGMMKSQH